MPGLPQDGLARRVDRIGQRDKHGQATL